MHSVTTEIRISPPRRPTWRAATTVISLTALTSLLLACVPAAPPPAAPPSAPAAAPAAPAPAAKPPAQPAPAPAAAPAAPAKPAAAPPEPSGSITLVMPEEPPTLDPGSGTGTVAYPVLRNVEEALLNRDPKTNQLVPELATKWEATNPTTWRFHLRQGVKFHDGTPFNAQAAADSITYTWSKENSFRIRSWIGPEFKVVPVDEYTIDIVTETPDPLIPTRMFFGAIVSPKMVKENVADLMLKPVGTGPYKFVEWVKGQHIKLTANPDWWGRTAPDAGGAQTIKDLTFVTRVEREVRTAMVQRGEADYARWVSEEQCKAAPQCKSGVGIETLQVRMDFPNPVLGDRRIREAIALAMDKESLMRDIFGGGEVTGFLGPKATVGWTPDIKPYPYNPERAKQLVAEARAAGVPLDTTPLTFIARRGSFFRIEEAAEAIGEMLQKVGLTNLKVQVLETAAHIEIWSADKPIAPSRGIIGVNAHGNELLDLALTVKMYYDCEGKQSVYCDPKMQELENIALPLEGEARAKAWQAVAKYAYDQIVTIPIGYPYNYYAVSARLDWEPRAEGLILAKEMKLKQ
jgi:peptide/nickel transport system substrate-binding protein